MYKIEIIEEMNRVKNLMQELEFKTLFYNQPLNTKNQTLYVEYQTTLTELQEDLNQLKRDYYNLSE